MTQLLRAESGCNGHHSDDEFGCNSDDDNHHSDDDSVSGDGWEDYVIDSEEEERCLKQVPAHCGP